MPKNSNAPSQNWNVKDFQEQASNINKQHNKKTKEWEQLRQKEQKAWEVLKDYEDKGYDMSMHYNRFKTIGAEENPIQRGWNSFRKFTSEGAATIAGTIGREDEKKKYLDNVKEQKLRENNWKQKQADTGRYESKDDVWNVAGGVGEALPYVAGGIGMGTSKAATVAGRIAGDVARGATADAILGGLQHGHKENWDSQLAKEVGLGVAGQAVGTGIAETARALSKGANVEDAAIPPQAQPKTQAQPNKKLEIDDNDEIAKRDNEIARRLLKEQGIEIDDVKTSYPQEQALSNQNSYSAKELMGYKKDNPNDINLQKPKKLDRLPPKLPLGNDEEMKDLMKYAAKYDAIDEFLQKLPKQANKQKTYEILNLEKSKYDKAKEDLNKIVPVNINKKKPIKNYNQDTLREFEEADKAGVIPFANGNDIYAGGAVGGLESQFNNRDYDGDGEHTYKDNIYGAIAGIIGVKGAKKIFPNAFKDPNINKNSAGMFVGAKPDDSGAFSDVATRKTIREIDDSSASLNQSKIEEIFENRNIKKPTIKEGDYKSYELEDWLKHNELYAKYPELRNTPLIIENNPADRYNAMWNGQYISINIANKKGVPKDVILHEIQHAIQNKEKWARGGSLKSATRDVLKQREEALEVLNEKRKDFFNKDGELIGDFDEFNKFELVRDKLKSKSVTHEQAVEAYKSLWGEQQARATQQRMNYTPKQRAKEDWTKTLEKNEGKYDKPIVKYESTIQELVDDPVVINNLKKIEKEIKNKPHETLVITDKEGKVLSRYKGGESSVSINKDESNLIKQYKDEKILTHNHPSATSFSWDDINFAVDKNIDEIRAVGHDPAQGDFLYELSGVSNIKDTPSQIKETWDKFFNSMFPYFEPKALANNRKNLKTVFKAHTHDTMKKVAKHYGLEYRRTRLKKSSKSIVEDIKLNASPTISGGMIGGVIGATSDLDGDGQITYKDILYGALGGAGATKSAIKFSESIAGKKAAKKVKDIANTDFVDAFSGHKLYAKKDYMAEREKMIVEKNKKMENFAELHEQLELLTDATKKNMHKYMIGEKDIELSQPLKQLADTYTKKIEDMGQELVDLNVLEKAQFEKFKSKYLHRVYEKDLTKDFQGAFKKGKTIRGVHTRGNTWDGTKKEYEQLLEDGKIGDFFDEKIEAIKLKNGQYRFTQDWTKEQRKKWGEVEDIAYTLPETLLRMSEMLEHARFLKNVTDKTKVVSGEELDGYVKLQGKRFGALDGKYVPKDVRSDITEFNRVMFGEEDIGIFSSDVTEAYNALSTFWKKSHTVYNPVAHVNNLMSNVAMQFMEGIGPVKALKHSKDGAYAHAKLGEFRKLTAKKLIGLTEEEKNKLNFLSKDNDLKLYIKANDAGLFGRSKLNDILGKYVKPSDGSKKLNMLGKMDEVSSKYYQGEDNIMRFSMLKSMIDKGESFNEAIKHVNRTIPDYTKPMSAMARFGRKSMLTPFISWTYYSTPIILRQLKERPERAAVILGALYGINKVMGINPYDKEDIPQKNFSMKRIPIYKKGREVTTLKVDRWMPHNEILSPHDFIKNLTNGGAWKGIYEVLNNRNLYYGSKISYNEGALKAYDITGYAISQISPDVLDKAWSIAESNLLDEKTRTKNPVIQPRTTTQEIINALGLNVLTYDKYNQKRKARQEKLNK